MSNSDTSSDHGDIEPLRKRQRRPETYKRNVIRTSKVKGLPHTNWRGKHIPARVTGPDCR